MNVTLEELNLLFSNYDYIFNNNYIICESTTPYQAKHIDITKEWINSATPNSNKVLDLNYYVHEGIKYSVDGKYIVLDYSKKEKEIAVWLEKNFGGEIYMIPRINIPENIKTPDYIFKGEKRDLKVINGKSNQVFYHAIYNKSNQSNNFIFDITNSSLTLEQSKILITKLYCRTDVPFIDKILLKKENSFFIYKKCDRTVRSARPHLLNINTL